MWDGNSVEIKTASRETRLFAVREVNSFEAKGRVFAYVARLVPVFIENGGAILSRYYVSLVLL